MATKMRPKKKGFNSKAALGVGGLIAGTALATAVAGEDEGGSTSAAVLGGGLLAGAGLMFMGRKKKKPATPDRKKQRERTGPLYYVRR